MKKSEQLMPWRRRRLRMILSVLILIIISMIAYFVYSIVTNNSDSKNSGEVTVNEFIDKSIALPNSQPTTDREVPNQPTTTDEVNNRYQENSSSNNQSSIPDDNVNAMSAAYQCLNIGDFACVENYLSKLNNPKPLDLASIRKLYAEKLASSGQNENAKAQYQLLVEELENAYQSNKAVEILTAIEAAKEKMSSL